MAQTDDNSLVWHYTNAGGLLGMIEHRQLWATHFQFMNDTLEGTVLAEALSAFTHENENLTPYERSMIGIMNQQYAGVSRHTFTRVPDGNHFLLCGSKEGDELTLWRNYAKDTISFAVGLDPSVPLGLIPPKPTAGSSGWVQPWTDVEYQKSSPHLPDEHVERILSAVRQEDPGDQIGEVSDVLHHLLFLVKSIAFKDERETRVVCGSDNTAMWRFRSGPFGVTPYVALGTSSNWNERSSGKDPLPIRSIRISANANKADTLALNALLESNGFGGGAEVEEIRDERGVHVDTHHHEYSPPVEIHQTENTLRM